MDFPEAISFIRISAQPFHTTLSSLPLFLFLLTISNSISCSACLSTPPPFLPLLLPSTSTSTSETAAETRRIPRIHVRACVPWGHVSDTWSWQWYPGLFWNVNRPAYYTVDVKHRLSLQTHTRGSACMYVNECELQFWHRLKQHGQRLSLSSLPWVMRWVNGDVPAQREAPALVLLLCFS